MLHVKDIETILDAEELYGINTETTEVHSVCGSDMMSDVLAYVHNQSVLLTGLCNPQTIRTAEMMDIVCVVFVRNKKPNETMLQLARDCGITLLATPHTMFTACGLLYEAGMRGGA